MIDTNDKRFWLWIGKWMFPEIDTKRTDIMFIPKEWHNCYLPQPRPIGFSNISDDILKPPKTLRIDLNKFGYKSYKHRFVARFGYCRELDRLIAVKDSFQEVA